MLEKKSDFASIHAGFLHVPEEYDAMTRSLCQVEKRIFSGFSVIIAARIAILPRNRPFQTGEKPMPRKIAGEMF